MTAHRNHLGNHDGSPVTLEFRNDPHSNRLHVGSKFFDLERLKPKLNKLMPVPYSRATLADWHHFITMGLAWGLHE